MCVFVCPMKVRLAMNYFYLTDLRREEVRHRGRYDDEEAKL